MAIGCVETYRDISVDAAAAIKSNFMFTGTKFIWN